MVPDDKSHKPGKTQVPGQLLGYGLQYTRMLSLLLESDGNAIVSLEVFEDVVVQNSAGALASQTKSSIAGQNPVSNRAEPFWKSLNNWLEAIKAGQLSVTDTVFELYVFGDFSLRNTHRTARRAARRPKPKSCSGTKAEISICRAAH